jgi:hypothetical protein
MIAALFINGLLRCCHEPQPLGLALEAVHWYSLASWGLDTFPNGGHSAPLWHAHVGGGSVLGYDAYSWFAPV